MKRRLTLIALTLLLLPLLFCLWVMGTSNGLHWLLTKATLPNALEIGAVEGNLISGVRITKLRYHDANMNITLDEALLDWRPSSLLRNKARLEMLYLQHPHIELLSKNSSGGSAPLQLPTILLPLSVQIDDMQVNDLEIVQPEQPLIHINNIALRAQADRIGVTMQYLDISTNELQLSVQGKLHPYADYWHDLEVQWQLQLEDLPPFNGSATLKGDLRKSVLQHQLIRPAAATAQVTIFDPLHTLRWEAKLQVPKQPLNTVHKEWPATTAALTARGHGDLERATVEAFSVDALNSSAQGKGTIEWKDGFKWQSDIDSRRFDLAALWQLLDVKGPMVAVGVKGGVSGDLDHLAADDVTLDALDGVIKGDVQVSWKDKVHWRTSFQAEQFEMSQLWPLIALDGMGLPTGRADLATTLDGDSDQMSFSNLSLAALGAAVHGEGNVEWSPELQWQMTLDGEGINPAAWQPQRLAEWPGNLAIQFHHIGGYTDNQLQGAVEIKQLDGTLRNYPFQAQAQLQLAQGQLEVKRFDLTSAKSRIEAHGKVGDEVALQWQLHSPQLEQLYPAASGVLNIEGELNGKGSSPNMKMKLDGKSLAYEGQEIGTLKGNAKLQLFTWQQIAVDLQAKALQLGGEKVDEINLSAKGEAAQHQLQLHLKTTEIDTQWQLNGNFDSVKQSWHGQVDKANFKNPDFGLWQLSNASALNISHDQLTLAPLCWQQKEAQLCLDAQQHQGAWQATLRGDAFNLSLFSPWLPRDLETHGEATLFAAMRYAPQQPLSGQVLLALGSGAISYPIVAGERSEWHFEGGRWSASLNEEGLRSQLQLSLAGNDRIKASLYLKNYNPLTSDINKQPINGEINAAFSDLGLLNNLLFDVQGLQGRIEVNSTIAGTVTQPELKGELQLHDGSMQIPRLGLSLTGLNFNAKSHGTDLVSYQLQAHSGEGSIEAKGETTLNSKEGWPTHITLSGSMFEVSHIPEARVVVSPKLDMRMAKREIWLEGEVVVPYARLEPKEFTSTVSTSDDVVIAGAPESNQQPWLIHNKVRLILGDRVSLKGFGFDGKITGNLLLIDEPGQITAATGELSVVNGRYEAYGRTLDIEQGKLTFAGGPVTKPGLDLRAVRQIQDITAGAKVYGTLQKPVLEVYSNPAMEQSEALSYLIFGKSQSELGRSEGALLAQAILQLSLKGGDVLARSIGKRFGIDEIRLETSSTSTGEQASLIIGQYLSPRFYVGYSVGVIDAVNILTLRYNLSQHWQLKAESGAAQSADMIYTIQR